MCWADGERKRWIPIKQMDLAYAALLLYCICHVALRRVLSGRQDMKSWAGWKMGAVKLQAPVRRLAPSVGVLFLWHQMKTRSNEQQFMSQQGLNASCSIAPSLNAKCVLWAMAVEKKNVTLGLFLFPGIFTDMYLSSKAIHNARRLMIQREVPMCLYWMDCNTLATGRTVRTWAELLTFHLVPSSGDEFRFSH